MVSSRKQENVDRTVQELKAANLAVEGVVCHVGKAEDRKNLIDQVRPKMKCVCRVTQPYLEMTVTSKFLLFFYRFFSLISSRKDFLHVRKKKN